MPINKNNAYSLPYELNNKSEASLDSRKIGSNKRANGLAVANEILFSTYESMSFPNEGNRMNGMVIAEPTKIAKSDMVNFFSNANFPLADKDSADVEEYIRVYVRIPKEHMSVGIPSDFVQSMGINNINLPSKASVGRNLAYTVMHPYFFMPVNSTAPDSIIIPQVGDIVEVLFSDTLKTHGFVTKIIDSWIGTPVTLEDLKTSSPDAFTQITSPISSVFKADKGPIATPAKFPADISKMAPGKRVQVGTGETIDTIVVDNKLLDAKVTPHLVAMFLAAKADGIDFSPLTSGFRVGFIKDNLTVEELNDLTQGAKYKNWDGNPYPKFTSVGASQERLRYVNCGPNGMDRDAKCDIATGYPVRPGAWKGQKKSGHMMGNGVDVKMGSWGGRPSSKIKTARPDLLTAHYRWLSLNAWKYGFIRTVRSERWHWEYLPGKSQFSRVPRDNPLWDSQFDEAFARYEEEAPAYNPLGPKMTR